MKDTKENRINFLKENNAYEAFVDNTGEDFDFYLDPGRMPYCEFIAYPFSWDKTPEGHYFWESLNDEYFSMID